MSIRTLIRRHSPKSSLPKRRAAFRRTPNHEAAAASHPTDRDIFIQRTAICPCDGGCPRCDGVIQPKLTINKPGDKYEQEADRIADQVMRMPEPGEGNLIQTKPVADQITPLIQRQEIEPEEEETLQTKLGGDYHLQRQEDEEEEEEEPIQTKQISNAPRAAPPDLSSRIRSLKGGGQPLPESAREYFQRRFRRSLRHTRIHTDSRAAETARALNAKAYTVGKDIFFDAVEYSPKTRAGKRLLAHELTHVVQQTEPAGAEKGRQRPSMGKPSVPGLQRQSGSNITTVDWATGVTMAEKAAKERGGRKTAMKYYKELIARAAQKVIPPAPLVNKIPTANDIHLSWRETGKYSATADPKKVNAHPKDYWKWLTFYRSAVHKDEAFTVSLVLHELDHAAHAKALHDAWKTATRKKGTWEEFYLQHYGKWREKPIAIPDVGIIGALAGLPKKIRPSAIEFRAYANQFVNYFHKLSLEKQEWLCRAIILFYPVRVQKVTAAISDPALDLAKARQKLLNYFKAPPTKDKNQRPIIKTLMASQLQSALILFRSGDRARIGADFQVIIDFQITRDKRKEARKNYKPEPV